DCFLRIFLYDPYTHVVSTLCLHDALPISGAQVEDAFDLPLRLGELQALDDVLEAALGGGDGLLQLADLEIVLDEPHLGEDGGERSEEHTSDSSHVKISYAVFCMKKKNDSS